MSKISPLKSADIHHKSKKCMSKLSPLKSADIYQK